MTQSSDAQVAERILNLLGQGPKNFYEILQALGDVEYRSVLIAWGIVQEQNVLRRDDHGHYLLAAKPGDAR